MILLLTGVSSYCQTDPPDPGEIPPDLPINENITILLLIALLYGFFIIYKHIQSKKASI
ncbi:hypothetical protein [Flavobacterium aquariorum]|uniref:hypothetical protein n=1 Tax=Flavobacterium aquariorum TaxID=2217670 RepID=UPI0014030706|nr:hypothetical protein [Flavobacterium aquariorum]